MEIGAKQSGHASDAVFAGTMHGPVFVGDEPPYESLPWYRKTSFAVAFIVVAGCAFAVLVLLMAGRGALELLSRGHALPPNLRAWVLAFALIWSACMAMNVTRVLRTGAARMGAFDLASGTASPALTAGGFVAYPLYFMASPVFAVLVAAIIVAAVVTIFKDSIEPPSGSRIARIGEIGAVLGTLLLLAFVLYTL